MHLLIWYQQSTDFSIFYILPYLFSFKDSMRAEKAKNLYKNWGVKLNQNEMFGPAKRYTVQAFKKLKLKRRTWYFCSFFFTMIIVFFAFSFSPPHLDIKLPSDKDLLDTPLLRGQDTTFDIEQNRNLKEQIIEFITDSCDQFSFDVIFCHMVTIDEQRFNEPCLMICDEKTFFANLKVTTTEDTETIECTEMYSNIQQKKTRRTNIVFTGERFVKEEKEDEDQGKMQSFTIIPKLAKDVCLYQHATEILKGTWIET